MRCLVTGASGHLGSFLTARLLKHGWDVTALVRPESDLWRLAAVRDQVNVIRADLAHMSSAAAAIHQAKPESVFHLAWQDVKYANRPERVTADCNLAGSLELFRIIRDSCKLWVGVGSQAEYGRHNEVLTEVTPEQPETIYGKTKLEAASQTRRWCTSLGSRYVWLRLLAIYGPMDHEHHLIPTVIRQLLKGERPKLTSGEQLWDYLYVEDAAEAICRTAITVDAEGVFNLGSGESHSIADVVTRIRNLIDPSAALGFGEVPYAPNQVMRMETSIDRLRHATGWRPEIDLDEGLRRTIAWYTGRHTGAE